VTRLSVSPASLPPGAIVLDDPAGVCTPSGEQKFTCDGSGEGSGSLTVTPPDCELIADPEQGQCVPPYVPAPDPQNPQEMICVGQGPGENCMRGYTYNALLRCCTAENTGTTQDFGCPPGFDLVDEVCVNAQSGDPPQAVSQDFGPVAYCAPPPGGGDPGSCTPPQNCNYGVDPNDPCKCYSPVTIP
jgi:hypothetical protein